MGHFSATYCCSYDTSHGVMIVFMIRGLMKKPSVFTWLQQSAPLYNICIFWHPIRREVSLSETFRVYISVKIYSGDKTGCTRTIFLSVSCHVLFHLRDKMFLLQVLTDQFGNRCSKIIKINIAVCSLRAGI